MATMLNAAFDEPSRQHADLAIFKDRYCIIGAGPAGLATARCLSERGIAFDIVERHADVGGIWDMSNPDSPMYESAHFISSKSVSGFTDLQFPDSVAEYPSWRDVLELIRA